MHPLPLRPVGPVHGRDSWPASAFSVISLAIRCSKSPGLRSRHHSQTNHLRAALPRRHETSKGIDGAITATSQCRPHRYSRVMLYREANAEATTSTAPPIRRSVCPRNSRGGPRSVTCDRPVHARSAMYLRGRRCTQRRHRSRSLSGARRPGCFRHYLSAAAGLPVSPHRLHGVPHRLGLTVAQDSWAAFRCLFAIWAGPRPARAGCGCISAGLGGAGRRERGPLTRTS